jgi:hypothetical protein
MSGIINEKDPLQNSPSLGHPAPDHSLDKRRLLSKIFTLFALTGLILWLFRTDCEELRLPKVMSVSDASMGVSDARKQYVDTGSQSLRGQFGLLDLLSIDSSSGSISVSIQPQPADKDSPAPAELLIHTQSGQVNVDYPALNAPKRDYRLSIETASGKIAGHVIHGESTSISSSSARIVLQVSPYAAGDYASSLRTSTTSGSQQISLLSPATEPGVAIKHMSSSHSSESGTLTLRYPQEWEGTIEGSTGSGSINLHGGNLNIIHREPGNSGHSVLAKKGNGNSTLGFHTASGNVDIYFG